MFSGHFSSPNPLSYFLMFLYTMNIFEEGDQYIYNKVGLYWINSNLSLQISKPIPPWQQATKKEFESQRENGQFKTVMLLQLPSAMNVQSGITLFLLGNPWNKISLCSALQGKIESAFNYGGWGTFSSYYQHYYHACYLKILQIKSMSQTQRKWFYSGFQVIDIPNRLGLHAVK